MQWTNGEYIITDEREKVDVDKLHEMLSKTYWAANRTKDTTIKSLDKVICFSMYYNNEQIGFARVITDEVVFSWICDIIVEEKFRGKGLGSWLMECVMNHPKIKNTRQALSTSSAYGLYEKCGFIRTETMYKLPKK